MIKLYTFKPNRRGTIRKVLAGFLVGAILTASVAVYLHQTRACLTDAGIAEILRITQ